MHDIDQGPTWNDGFAFGGITFSSVVSGGGVVATTSGVATGAGDIGAYSEYASWKNSTAAVTSFTVNYLVNSGKTHAYLGYSMQVTPVTLKVTGENVICSGGTALLKEITSYPQSWALESDPTTVISTDTFIYVSPTVTTTYICFNTQGAVRHTVIVDNPIVGTDLGPDDTICPGQSITLQSINSPLTTTFQWQNGSTNASLVASTAGEYWLKESNACGFERDTFNLVVRSLVQGTDLGPDDTLCVGESVTLSSINALSTTTSIEWQDGSHGATFTASTTGTYWIKETNLCGFERDTFNLIIDNPIVGSNLGPDDTICQGQSITLFANNATATTKFEWQDGSTNSTLDAGTTGLYWLNETNACGSARDTFLLITEMPIQGTDLGKNKIFCLGKSIVLSSSNLDPKVKIEWQNGSHDLVQVINKPGIYWIAESNTCGTVTDSIKLEGLNCSYINLVIPNLVTPNGDGLNDLFVPIESYGIASMYTEIYNRWGVKVYETENLYIEWDSKDITDGVYYWSIHYKDVLNSERDLKGYVQVVK
jgi:gliding motility-associated-like protein